jgi:hypothetical protein
LDLGLELLQLLLLLESSDLVSIEDGYVLALVHLLDELGMRVDLDMR